MNLRSLEPESGGRIPARFDVGDRVDVLNPIRLPKVEQVIHIGFVHKITTAPTSGEPIYWITGRLTGTSARVLRLVQRRNHDLWNAYPKEWPACPGCGNPVMDGHTTCREVR